MAHYPALRDIPEADLVAVSELNEQRLHKVCDEYKIKGRYTDYRQMLQHEKPDAVYAITGGADQGAARGAALRRSAGARLPRDGPRPGMRVLLRVRPLGGERQRHALACRPLRSSLGLWPPGGCGLGS